MSGPGCEEGKVPAWVNYWVHLRGSNACAGDVTDEGRLRHPEAAGAPLLVKGADARSLHAIQCHAKHALYGLRPINEVSASHLA